MMNSSFSAAVLILVGALLGFSTARAQHATPAATQAQPSVAGVEIRPAAALPPGTRVVLRSPSPTIPQPTYYVDGQLYVADNLNDISPRDIASINVVKGDLARWLLGDAAANGAVLITTTANQNRADVRAFNEKAGTPAPAPATNGSR